MLTWFLFKKMRVLNCSSIFMNMNRHQVSLSHRNHLLNSNFWKDFWALSTIISSYVFRKKKKKSVYIFSISSGKMVVKICNFSSLSKRWLSCLKNTTFWVSIKPNWGEFTRSTSSESILVSLFFCFSNAKDDIWKFR